MAKYAKYNVDSVAQKKKIVCVSLTYLCKSIYSEFGIKSYISTPNGGDKHIYNIIQFSDGKNIKADLQQDLSNIQTKSRTTSFAQGYDCAEENLDVFSNEEIYEIQRQLGYVNDSSEYMDEKIKLDYIFHAASITSSRTMIMQPIKTIITSVDGTNNILRMAHEKEAKSVVYISSMEMYGNFLNDNLSGENCTEEKLGYIDPLKVRSNYPESKRMCENLCVAYASLTSKM